MSKWLALVGISALLSVGFMVAVRFSTPLNTKPAEAYAEKGPKQSLEPLWPVPPFAFVSHRGTTVTAQSLRGRVWVANFIFTQCRTICPLLTAKMTQLQRRLAGVDVDFVSFSVDPRTDTPDVLAAYARRWAPREPRWTLLSTTTETLPALARGFHITAAPAPAASLDSIIHSAVFVLVDQQGQVRGVFDSELAEDFESLGRAVRLLSNQSPAPAPEPVAADALYHELACATCHENDALAPSLLGLAGQRRELENGLSATYDQAYVRESILSPDAKRVRGYPLHMPTYAGLLSDNGLATLTQWLLARGAGAPLASDAGVEIDPVCHMQVRATADALSELHDGRRVYFCSDHCRTRFAASPSAYLPSPDAGPAQ